MLGIFGVPTAKFAYEKDFYVKYSRWNPVNLLFVIQTAKLIFMKSLF